MESVRSKYFLLDLYIKKKKLFLKELIHFYSNSSFDYFLKMKINIKIVRILIVLGR